MKKTGAVVVAAGLSSRMGDFKPMLPYGESTISKSIVMLLKQCGIEPVIVVTGYQAERLEEHLRDTGACFVRNEGYRETEMFDSVKMGLEKAVQECQRIMVMPGDIPAVRRETIEKLLAVDTGIVRPVFCGETGHPVMMEKDIAAGICNYRGPGGLRAAVESQRIPILNLEVADEGVCRDVDTKEEYRNLIM